MEKEKKRLIIFTDIGDTIIDEGTEVRNAQGVVIHAECIPGAKETYLRLYEKGYTIVMVADGLTQSFHNTMKKTGWTTSSPPGSFRKRWGRTSQAPKCFPPPWKRWT